MTQPPPPAHGPHQPQQPQQSPQPGYVQPGYPAPGYGPATPVKKKRPVWPWIVGALVLIPLLLLGGCIALLGGAANEIDKQENKEHTITYKVTATDKASVSYGTNGSSTATAYKTWTKEEKVKGTEWPTLSVVNDFDSKGTITCEILVDGVSKDKKSAEGPGSSVACSSLS